MRKLLSLVTLCCVMVIGAGVSVSCASAATLFPSIHSLKVEHTSVVERADYYRVFAIGIHGIIVTIGIRGAIVIIGIIGISALLL